MAKYGIFGNNNVCLRLASDEAIRDDMLSRITYSVAKEITDEQFDDAGKDKISLSLDDNGNVSVATQNNPLSLEGGEVTGVTTTGVGQPAFCQELIDYQKSRLKSYLRVSSNQGQPDYEIWQDYQNKLNELNVDDMTFPMEQTFQEWFNSQPGNPTKFILQLP